MYIAYQRRPLVGNVILGVKMERTTERVEDSVWAAQLKEELEKQTGRTDIEVTVSRYSSYDALVSCAADRHPVVNLLSQIQGDPSRLKVALDYAIPMLQNWEATQVLHDKAKTDCLPFYQKIVDEFPHLEVKHTVFEHHSHFIQLAKVDDKVVAYFDLWPTMTESDVERVIAYLKDFESTLKREGITVAGATYFWG